MPAWMTFLRDTSSDADLASNVFAILRPSPEPLAIAHIRGQLGAAFRHLDEDDLADWLERQVAAGVLYRFPKYRGSQERYWHRPPRVHLENLVLKALADGPLAWHSIQRKLPEYARVSAEKVLAELLDKGRIFRHPPQNSRQGPRYGLMKPDAREYVRPNLVRLLQDVQAYDLDFEDLRRGLVELLQTEDWSHLKKPKVVGGHDSW